MASTTMSKRKSTAVDFTTTSPQTNCRLLSLPPELKNNIYEMALQGFNMELLLPTEDDDEPLCKAPGLVLTCKKIHQDTIKMFYSTVTIVVSLDESTPDFWTNSNHEGRRRLAKYLRTIGRTKSALLTSLIEAPAIQPLHPDLVHPYRNDDHNKDPYLTSFRYTIQQKSDLIEFAKHALGRSLLKCWFKHGADGKPQYSKNPVQRFKEWSKEMEQDYIQAANDQHSVFLAQYRAKKSVLRAELNVEKKIRKLRRRERESKSTELLSGTKYANATTEEMLGWNDTA
jgi:hypothetical protein